MSLDSELADGIREYLTSEKHRWGAAFRFEKSWRENPDRRAEIMVKLTTELRVTDDQIYILLNAAKLANTSDSIRILAERLSPSHFSRMARAAERYGLGIQIIEEYLELAVKEKLSAQALIEEVTIAHDPDKKLLFHRALRGMIKACQRLLELDEYNRQDNGEVEKILVREFAREVEEGD